MRVQRILTQTAQEQPKKDNDLALLNDVIEKYKHKKGSLIPLLQGAQNIYGYLPEEVFHLLAKKTGHSLSTMYGVATFYAQFRLNPVGKHIVKICHGTACHVQNAKDLTNSIAETLKIADGETTKDGLFTLESVACLGCCSLAPVMMIDDDTHGKLNGKTAVKILKKVKRNTSKKK